MLLGIAIWILRTKRDLRRLLQVANLTAVILFVGALGIAGVRLQGVAKIKSSAGSGFEAAAAGSRPDVFYVILDAYTGSESLKKYWGYDNSWFIDHLRRRGFTIVTNAASDYAFTPMCILSAFNMNLVPLNMDEKLHTVRLGSNRMIRDSRVARQFEEMGYELVNLSLFDLRSVPRAYEFGPRRHGPFQAVLKNSVWGRWRQARWNRHMNSVDVGQMNLDLVHRMAACRPPAAGERPKFVYVHLMLPHMPYIFDADGRRRPNWADRGDLTNSSAYLDQLIFTSKLMRTNLDALLSNYPEPPIVVLQGDHGFRWLNHPDAAAESTTILNALLLPGNRGARLPPDLRPLNTFRFLFNEYFGAQYEYLTNRPPEGNPLDADD